MRRGKRTIAIIAAVSMVLGLCIPALAFSGAGSGTQADPYVITDVYELQEMSDDLTACYVLGNDIDASATSGWNGGAGFEPVGTFTGIFDGRGHTITGFYINRPNTNGMALFSGTVGAEIKNLGMAEVDITGSMAVGALVNYNDDNSTVCNCWSSGNVKSTYAGANTSGIGGLVGSSADGSLISKCYSTASVNGNDAWQYGGLVGRNIRGSIIVDCYATGDVTGTHKVGGLVGDNMHGSQGGYVARCYSTGKVTGNGGGLIGYNWQGGVTYDSYWDRQTSGKSTSYGGTPKTTAEMMQQATFVGWDFDEIWDIDEGQSYPYFMEPRILEGLEITGPDEVAEAFSAQYKAIAHYDNGSTVDVTSSADWSVDDEIIASINAGLLTTEMVDLPTDITITAEYSEGENTQEAEKEVSIFAICPSGSALEFDGVDDYVDCGTDESLDMTHELTVSAWIKRSSFNTTGTVVGKNNGNSVTAGYGLFSYPEGVEFNFYSSNGWRRTKPRVAVTPNQWHHVTGTFNGNIAYLYVDGEQRASLAYNGDITIATGYPVQIAYWRSQNTEYFDGSIDQVSIYNRVLSAEEIQVLMHTRPEGDDPNLVAYWAFDEGEGQAAGDSSLYGNDGQLGSGPGEDDSDPVWVDSDAPIGICTLEELVERNIFGAIDIKLNILDELERAMAKEQAAFEILDTAFRDHDFRTAKKDNAAKAKQKIHSAIQHEEQAVTAVDKSIDKLEDALEALDIK